ncbi:putative epoxide hydrolase [Pseudocercospora fuligena]|uniref:Putative epoxide hydrolase n=1 Tax=Pseudocercospora fuligena TaxID=685502 RepID=A0A8H6VDQ0_9PEZI|nr:putative epoxide hydrolase [Pseudocercospora fuligena]
MPFDSIPSKATLNVKPFKAHVSDEDLNDFKQLLKLSKIGPKAGKEPLLTPFQTYENQVANVKDYLHFGITHKWLSEAKQRWQNGYDWRKTEARINSFPNYVAEIEDRGFTYNVQFLALFSKNPNAVPLLVSHGWPGSILEFIDTLDLLRKKYSEDDLPFHVITPSLPGYGYTNGPPLDRNTTTEEIAAEKKGVERCNEFATLGNAYARHHGTRPATIGLVLSASPISLLAWIGEKFQQWSDETPPLDQILDGATLYWFTQSFPRAIFPYRQFFGAKPTFFHNDPAWYIKKPLGYSWHPEELAPVPQAWVKETGNLVWYKEHDQGGHFAAMEKPELFVTDMENFVAEVWPKAKSG